SIVVRAHDDPQDLSKPRGKQDWQLEPHSIWYYRTTGIWQTVWSEMVPATRIESVRWTPDVPKWSLHLQIGIARSLHQPLRLRVTLRAGERTLAQDTYAIDGH